MKKKEDYPRKCLSLSAAMRQSKRFRKHYYSEAYVLAIKAMHCLSCRKRPCHAHHVKTKGAGGTYRDLVPLCPKHHMELHNSGRKTFAAGHSVNLTEQAERIYLLLAPMRGDNEK